MAKMFTSSRCLLTYGSSRYFRFIEEENDDSDDDLDELLGDDAIETEERGEADENFFSENDNEDIGILIKS